MSGTKRQPVPEPVKRDILLEAGYRCAIPRCMAHTLEIAHIVSYEESGGDNLRENPIALCPNHHTMYDIEKKIDRKAIRIIKNKLGIISSRYNDFEQRVFRHFAKTILSYRKFISLMQWKMRFSL
jgi:predicted restriction endonuclease